MRYIPSVSNHFLVDVRRPGREISAAFRSRGILVGRTWTSLPAHVRVTIGTPDQMNRFKTAFQKAMG